eukprot:TCONS_00027736-protein
MDDADTGSESEDESDFWLFDTTDSSSEDENIVEDLKRKANSKKVGRPSIVSKHPEIIASIKPSSNKVRRLLIFVAEMTVLQKHGISMRRKAVHYLLNPPRKGTMSSKRYKGFIQARVPPKRNTKEKKEHPDFHFTSVQVKLINELSYLSSDNTLTLSVDNKNKVEVGIPATSRRSQIRTFYLTEDSPNYNDHDFPHSNCKLVPAGYQILQHRTFRSSSVQSRRGNFEIYSKRRSRSVDSSLTGLK